ncbi:hypothetical protein AMK20_10235 [Streptomyces sp. TSRI0261]|uniref:SCO2400 family protein n=1 Tax=Streptomyces sp. TSRI0261 TaxID=1703931 RepID=UPI000938F002|nr:hypothetical protein [Streptomyces sp. TSRI0261]OKJ12733.1 hypothetical protein AMK20_10235 [Streptomyces sp. TSRI0261]
MDYCHPCRRHLNGALACAGCGTPAEALGPCAVPAPGGPAPGALDVPDGTAAPSGAGDARRGTRRDARLDARRDARRGAGGRPDARPGSRRRARGGHRRRGRTVLLGALGLLLAAGALSLAELAMEPGRDDTAADFVRESPSEPSGAPSEDASADAPRDPGPVGSRTGAPAGPATDASPVGTREGSPSGAPGPEASGPDEPTASPDPGDAAPSDAADSPPADPPEPDDPREPTTAPAPPPPSAEPTPTPTPSPTCTRFLWWCT